MVTSTELLNWEERKRSKPVAHLLETDKRTDFFLSIHSKTWTLLESKDPNGMIWNVSNVDLFWLMRRGGTRQVTSILKHNYRDFTFSCISSILINSIPLYQNCSVIPRFLTGVYYWKGMRLPSPISSTKSDQTTMFFYLTSIVIKL